jgi:hypothetical protein
MVKQLLGAVADLMNRDLEILDQHGDFSLARRRSKIRAD